MSEKEPMQIESEHSLKIVDIIDVAQDYANDSTAKNTQRAYATGWKSFLHWCSAVGANPLTTTQAEGLISCYIAHLASTGSKIATIRCYLSAILATYRARGIEINGKHSKLMDVLKGISRTLPKRPTRKAPILTEDIFEMVRSIPLSRGPLQNLPGIRDKALLLLGFSGAFRRSELVALTITDLTWTSEGVSALVVRSKNDQQGEGLEKRIPYTPNVETCPVTALREWLDVAEVKEGPIFRSIDRHGNISEKALSREAVACIVKQYVKGDKENYSGHSLRAGFITSATIRGVSRARIMQHTGHKSSAIDVYIRLGESFSESAAGMVGL